MSQKIKYILLSLGILVISLTLLICFVVVKNDKISSEPLTLEASDITLTVGEKTKNFFTVSNENAQIEIIADDPTLFSIVDNELVALKPGNTKITISASFDGDKAKTSFILTIENESYTYLVSPIQNCTFSENSLYMSSNACQFSIQLFDKVGIQTAPENINISASNNANIIKEISSFVLISQDDCVVTIDYPNIEFQIVINVVKI